MKAKTEKTPDRANVRTMLLPVELSQAEVMVRAKELTAAVRDQGDAQDRLEAHNEAAKTTKKGIEDEISAFQVQIRSTARVVASGREDRDVEVYDELDYKAGSVFTKRADTEEIVGTRGMTEHERQRSLWPGGKRPASDTPDEPEGGTPPTIQ